MARELLMAKQCKLCGSIENLVKKSHVIPLWMYEFGAMRLLSTYPNEHEQRSHTGIYGQFVCSNCEDKFQKWDDYAAKVLRAESSIKTIKALPTDIQVYDFGQYNYLKLKLFFLSVLWRSHACDHHFFSEIDLGSFAPIIESCLLYENKEQIDLFDIIATYSNKIIVCGVVNPRIVQIENIYYWQLYLPHYQALIKVDDSPGYSGFKPILLSEYNPLYMVEKSFEEFDEIKYFHNIFLENQRKKSVKAR